MSDEGGSIVAGKLFVLDTSTIIYEPECLNVSRAIFGDNDVVVPIMALRELDGLKTDMRRGSNARQAIRLLGDTFPTIESMRNGVKTTGGGHMRVVGVNGGGKPLPKEYLGNTGDDLILGVANSLAAAETEKPEENRRHVILVTKDASLRLKARAAGIDADDLKTGKVERPQSLAPRIANVDASREIIDELYNVGSIPIDGLPLPFGLHLNACIRLSDPDDNGNKKSALGIFVPGDRIVVVRKGGSEKGKRGISPRNAEQIFAYEMAMRPDILTTILVGTAGTGKTLMALKAGVDLLETHGSGIRRIVCFRPMIDIGPALGFLPGDIDEKYAPWVSPIYTNLQLLLAHRSNSNGSGDGEVQNGDKKKQQKLADPKERFNKYIKDETISVQPVTFIRGTTLPNSFIIVDEAQNLTPHEIKALLTRAGEGSRVVLTGDLTQIDSPHLDAASCGLAKALERMKGHPSFAAIELIKGERSRLATIIAELFADL